MKNIAFLLPKRFELLDFAGPVEVFSCANRNRGDKQNPYSLHLLSVAGPKVMSVAGITVGPTIPYSKFSKPIDTLLVIGGDAAVRHQPEEVLSWLRNRAKSVRRLASICTGAFILGEAGLLDGRRAVTHWRFCQRLACRFPAVKVEVDPIYIREGRLYTSAGVSAGIDLSLALVEEDLGPTVAALVSRDMVLHLHRSGGQKQFSTLLQAQATVSDDRLRDLPEWVAAHLKGRLDVASLARAAGMSSRNFARRFREHFRMTPAVWVTKFRVETAKSLIEGGSRSLKEVAYHAGFGDLGAMRRAFMREVGVNPREFSLRFSRTKSARSRHRGKEKSTDEHSFRY